MAAPSRLSPNQASETAAVSTKETNETKSDNTSTAATATTEQQPAEAPVVLKDPASLKNPPTLTNPQELTYESTQSSDAFVLAKNLLQNGDFDNALETIGMTMSKITSLLSEEDASVHEAMAPLYYLYGTTLLYSIEESSDNISAMPTTGDDNEDEPDDSQIAWENLETARHIVQRMVMSSTSSTTDVSQQHIKLDLAQIHLRLGDLSKANGRYQDAIGDYQACLDIRFPILGKFHRKVAAMYHALALVHMMLASEGDKCEQDVNISPEQMEESRKTSVGMYVACAKSFAGQIAFFCGANPETVTADATTDGGKTTGMDEAELALLSSSNTVRAIRERVQSLTTTGSENQETVEEFKELLDEIQETIDEVETSKEGIKQVSQMKAKAKAEADGVEQENADGSTTTIGFGNVSSGVAVAASVAPAAAAASAKPMMVIKKKKKREAEQDLKMPAQGDAKRAKSEE